MVRKRFPARGGTGGENPPRNGRCGKGNIHPHDISYKSFLGTKPIFLDFLACVLPHEEMEILKTLDWRKFPTEHVQPNLRILDNDIIWYAENPGNGLLHIVPCEAQSKIDDTMPGRMLRYMGNAVICGIEHLKNSGRWNGRFPIVTPLLVHNTDNNARFSMLDNPGTNGGFTAHAYAGGENPAYLDLGMVDFNPRHPIGKRNLAEKIHRLELFRRDPVKNRNLLLLTVAELSSIISEEEAEIQRPFLIWFRTGLFRDERLLEMMKSCSTIQEVNDMFQKNFPTWDEMVKKEAKAEGRAEGQAEVRSNLLCHLIQKRFGTVSATMRRQCMELTDAEAALFMDKILDAESPEAFQQELAESGLSPVM